MAPQWHMAPDGAQQQPELRLGLEHTWMCGLGMQIVPLAIPGVSVTVNFHKKGDSVAGQVAQEGGEVITPGGIKKTHVDMALRGMA